MSEKEVVAISKSVQYLIMIPKAIREQVRSLIEAYGNLLEARSDPHCDYSYALATDEGRLIIKQYSNGRLHIQGKGQATFEHLRDEVESILDEDMDAGMVSYPHCGTDEAGKGDYFGPLVVAGMYVKKEQVRLLRHLGITDSKTLSDDRCRSLAHQLRETLPGQMGHVILPPSTYNRLYQSLKNEGKNLNHLLAWGHARVIDDLCQRFPQQDGTARVVVDKFAAESVLRSRVPAHIDVLQVEKGEQFPAVAAASILARTLFIDELDRLAERFHLVLPKGGGAPTVVAGQRMVRQHGEDILNHVAKLHFSNTERIIG